MSTRVAPRRISRRSFAGLLAIAAGMARADVFTLPDAMPADAAATIDQLLRGRTPRLGRVRVDLPRLAENGLSVPLTVDVESPMSAADHVHTLHLIAPANPIPTVARAHFTPRSGQAFLSTRIRLADSQTVLALAEMSDGSVWAGKAPVVVTLGGCLDPVL